MVAALSPSAFFTYPQSMPVWRTGVGLSVEMERAALVARNAGGLSRTGRHTSRRAGQILAVFTYASAFRRAAECSARRAVMAARRSYGGAHAAPGRENRFDYKARQADLGNRFASTVRRVVKMAARRFACAERAGRKRRNHG